MEIARQGKRQRGNDDDLGLQKTGKGRAKNSGQITLEDDHA
jgi:hypothetical protein